MKLKNKILASVLAFVIGLGVIGLPAFGGLFSLAEETYKQSTNVLVVKNVEKAYDVSDNKTLKISDYVDPANDIQVCIKNPDISSVMTETILPWQTFDTNKTINFQNPGLYAMQFRREAIAGDSTFYIYSDVIYIPVSTKGVEGISLDGKLNSCVAPNTTVICPMPIDENWEEDLDVTVKVYTPFGEEIEAVKSSVTNKWSFTNKEGVLGVYYVEYTKNVVVGGYNQICYEYQTIEFSTDTTNTVSTKDYEKKDESSTVAEPKLVVKGSAIYDDEKLYLFKNYDLKGSAYVTGADGSTLDDADIFLTIYDEDTKKYFNFSDGEFNLSTATENGAKINIEDITGNFVCSDPEKKSKKVTFSYTSTVEEKDLSQTFTKEYAFNMTDVLLSSSTLLGSVITDITVVDKVEGDKVIVDATFPKVSLSAKVGYDFDDIKALITDVRLTIKPNSGTQVDSNTDLKDGIGITFNGPKNTDDPKPTIEQMLNREFTYHYNKKMTSSVSYLTVIYAVDFGDLGSKSVEYKVYIRESEQDKTAPTIKIDDYTKVLTTDNDNKIDFVIPNATAADKDDLGNTTVGADIVVKINGNGYSNSTVTMGETVSLTAGTYTISYIATDSSSNDNSRVKTISVLVKTNTIVDAALNMGTNTVSVVDGKVTINSSTNADYFTVYTAGKHFAPSKVEKTNGKVNFEFDLDEENPSSPCVVVYAKAGVGSTTYGVLNVVAGTIQDTFNSFCYSKVTEGYTLITPNTTKDANVYDKLLWFGGKDMTIECPKNGYYQVMDGNVYRFMVAGTYTITSTEIVKINGVDNKIKSITTLNIKNDQKQIAITQPIGNKIVASRDSKGNFEQVVLNYPVALTFFGYKLDVIIKDSKGDIVDPESVIENNQINIKFKPLAEDVYTINYIYRADDIQKASAKINFVAGKIARPQITLSAENKNVVWEGEKIKYFLADATAVDKNKTSLTVVPTVFDKNGKQLEVKKEDGKNYVELTGAGFYIIQYSATDSNNYTSVVSSKFAVEFPEESDSKEISPWAVVGIVFASVTGACAIALFVMFLIKKNKNKYKFINKNKQNKKKEKAQVMENTKVYTISESKDEKHWTLKSGNATIGKFTSKDDAINKANEVHKKGEQSIKVYNKNGRLIDSI